MSSAGEHFVPGRLWSLWKIMKHFHLRLFLSEIRTMETVIINPARNWDASRREKAIEVFSDIPQDCIDLGLSSSRTTAEKIVKLLSQEDCSVERFTELVRELQGRMIDETAAPRFFVISDQEADYYNNPQKGWEAIIARFPNSVGDIEEAYKCLALARYAAAVFHSLQVVEAGLVEFGKLIGITDPLPGWTATTSRLKKILDTKYPDRTVFEQANSAFLEQIHAAIHALQLAWRNKVSHVHGKLFLMTSDFHPEVAEEILVTSRALMRRLATEAPWPDASRERSS
jgi:hypothetical protein